MLRVVPAVLVSLVLPVMAHSGMEAETSVNLTRTGVSVVIRCAPELARFLLGPDAPRGPLATAVDAAREDLEKLAPTLVTLQSGESVLKPDRVRVVPEPGRHLAFVLRFQKTEGPWMLRTPFLARLDALEPAVVRFYDHTAFRRPPEPFASIELHSARQSARFQLGSAQLLDP